MHLDEETKRLLAIEFERFARKQARLKKQEKQEKPECDQSDS